MGALGLALGAYDVGGGWQPDLVDVPPPDTTSPIPSWDTASPSNPQPVQLSSVPVPAISSGQWVNTAISDGMKVLNSALAYSLLNNQISKGQPTTVAVDPMTGQVTGQSTAAELAAAKSGQIAGALSSSAWLFLIIGAVVLIMIARK